MRLVPRASRTPALRVASKGVCYAALVLLLIGLALSSIGRMEACRSDDVSRYPDYCAAAGVGAFVIDVYAVTLVPAMLAIGGGVCLVLDVVRRRRHRASRRTARRSEPG